MQTLETLEECLPRNIGNGSEIVSTWFSAAHWCDSGDGDDVKCGDGGVGVVDMEVDKMA